MVKILVLSQKLGREIALKSKTNLHKNILHKTIEIKKMPAHKNLANMSESKGEIKASTLPAVWYI